MLNESQQQALASFLTGYAKRWMEGRYDSLMRSSVVRPIMKLGPGSRYGIEAGLYLLIAYIDQKWNASTPFQSLLKEIVKDAPPEIAKRLVNGFRESILNDGFGSNDSDALPVQGALLDFDNESLLEFLKWYAKASESDRENLLRALSATPPERLLRTEVSGVAEPTPTPPTPSEPPKESKKPVPPGIRADLDRARERLGLPPRDWVPEQ
jgi:hypothetical protein